MKKTPMINPESQDIAELQQMVQHCLTREKVGKQDTTFDGATGAAMRVTMAKNRIF